MVQNQPCGLSIYHLGSLFAITLHTASHEAIILLALQNKLPEALDASVVGLYHPVREYTASLISEHHLLGLETSEFLDALIDVA